MKHKILDRCAVSYILFLLGAIPAAFLLEGSLLVFCIIFLSFIPAVVFWYKLYCPLMKITQTAEKCAAGSKHSPIDYAGDDELGTLAASVNFLTDSVSSAEESQRKFISNISHDFRSPLTSIKGYVEAIIDGTIPVEMQDKYLGIVLSETERLNKLTEGLLTLNTFDDRGVYLDLTDFDIVSLVQQTMASQEGLYNRKNIRVLTAFTSPAIPVHADYGRIQQVMYNLLDNAVKFSEPDSEILLRINDQKNRVFISVKDYGEGISKDNLSKIWDRFYKADTSRGRDKKGTGLGLSIVKEILRAHGQNIDVISTEGVGTEFVFTLDKSRIE